MSTRRRLWIYGDSYCERLHESSWTQLLADNIACVMHNRARSGSSVAFSATEFMRDLREEQFQEGDNIIFCASTTGRFHTRFQLHYPATACTFVNWTNQVQVFDHQAEPAVQEHFNKNKEHIAWQIDNHDAQAENYYNESVLHLLKSFAETAPEITILVLQTGFDYLTQAETFAVNAPKNFLRVRLPLYRISENEVVNPQDREAAQWVRATGYDARINHMTCTNNEIMAHLVAQAFKHRTADHIRADKFEQRVFAGAITTLQEYEEYCEKNYLVHDDVIHEHLITTPTLRVRPERLLDRFRKTFIYR